MGLIDADKLRDKWLYNGMNEKVYDTNDFLDSIDLAETVDPVKHSHWIVKRNNNGSIINFWCSSCGPDVNYVMDKYCPHCGAKMDEKGAVTDGEDKG